MFEPSTSTKCILPFAKSLSSLACKLTSPSLASITSLDCCWEEVKALKRVSISFTLFDTVVSKWVIEGVSPFSPCGPIGPCSPIGPCKPCSPIGPCKPCSPRSPLSPLGPINSDLGGILLIASSTLLLALVIVLDIILFLFSINSSTSSILLSTSVTLLDKSLTTFSVYFLTLLSAIGSITSSTFLVVWVVTSSLWLFFIASNSSFISLKLFSLLASFSSLWLSACTLSASTSTLFSSAATLAISWLTISNSYSCACVIVFSSLSTSELNVSNIVLTTIKFSSITVSSSPNSESNSLNLST